MLRLSVRRFCANAAAATATAASSAASELSPLSKALGGATHLIRNTPQPKKETLAAASGHDTTNSNTNNAAGSGIGIVMPIEAALMNNPTVAVMKDYNGASMEEKNTQGTLPPTPPYPPQRGPPTPIPTATRKYVLLYFSANWCPPCRQFTPILSKFYRELKDKKNFEVIFCSWDQNDEEFQTYFKTHPEWLAVDRHLVDNLATQYGINTIPSLLVLDATTGEIITRKGRLGVAHDPHGKDFPWKGVNFTSHVNVNAPKNAMLIGGAATFGASLLLWLFAQDRSSSATTTASSATASVATELLASALAVEKNADSNVEGKNAATA